MYIYIYIHIFLSSCLLLIVASAPLVASDGGEGILRLLDLLDSEKCSVTAFFINHLYDLLAVSKTREVSIPTLTKPIWGGSMPTLQVNTSDAYFEHFTVYDSSSRDI